MKITKCPPMPARGTMSFNGPVFPKTVAGGQVGAIEDQPFRNWTPWVEWNGKRKPRKKALP